MLRTTPILMAAGIAFLAYSLAHGASARTIDIGCSGDGLGDTDGDGLPEYGQTCTTPPCGCNCPAAGADFFVTAAGQEADGTAIVGCGYYLDASADPNEPDPFAPVGASVDPFCYGGALQCDTWG